jgi:hypothetical protein
MSFSQADGANGLCVCMQQQKKPKTTIKAEPQEKAAPAAAASNQSKVVSRKIAMNKQDDAESAKEHALFEKLKKKLSAQGPNSYSDFLKCLRSVHIPCIDCNVHMNMVSMTLALHMFVSWFRILLPATCSQPLLQFFSSVLPHTHYFTRC